MFFRSTFACRTHDGEAFPVINGSLAMMGPLSQQLISSQQPPLQSGFFIFSDVKGRYLFTGVNTSIHQFLQVKDWQGLWLFFLGAGSGVLQSRNLGTGWPRQRVELGCVLIWQKRQLQLSTGCGGIPDVALWPWANQLVTLSGICSECEVNQVADLRSLMLTVSSSTQGVLQ